MLSYNQDVLDKLISTAQYTEIGVVLNDDQAAEVTERNNLVKNIASILRDVNPYLFDSHFYDSITPAAASLLEFLLQFSPDRSFSGSSTDVYNKYNFHYNNFIIEANKILPTVLVNKIDLSGVEEVNRSIAGLKGSSDAYFKSIQETNNNAEITLNKIYKLHELAEKSQESIAVAKFKGLYQVSSQFHKTAALRWLSLVILLLVGLALYAKHSLDITENGEIITLQNNQLVLFLGTRIIIFTSFLYAINLSIRTYRAHKHNELTNKHRQNSLDTFEAFIKSTDLNDKGTKDAILLAVSQTIFTQPNTGFSSNDSDSEPTNKVVEIIKNVSNVNSKNII